MLKTKCRPSFACVCPFTVGLSYTTTPVSVRHFRNRLIACRDGPEWARQRACIQRLMMHPETATKYVDYQMPVAEDFANYLGSIRLSDGLVPDLYENLFKYTMECEQTHYV
jgi:hypothetical protein